MTFKWPEHPDNEFIIGIYPDGTQKRLGSPLNVSLVGKSFTLLSISIQIRKVRFPWWFHHALVTHVSDFEIEHNTPIYITIWTRLYFWLGETRFCLMFRRYLNGDYHLEIFRLDTRGVCCNILENEYGFVNFLQTIDSHGSVVAL